MEKCTGVQAEDEGRIGSVVCFVVAPDQRRQGIARQLLEAACEWFRLQGLEFAEAYPDKRASDEAHHFPGPLPLYISAGFAVTGESDRRYIVRKKLSGK